jgi:hypothetical protein
MCGNQLVFFDDKLITVKNQTKCEKFPSVMDASVSIGHHALLFFETTMA